MITSVLVVGEAISAVLGAALTVFMIPCLYTGENRYIVCLPDEYPKDQGVNGSLRYRSVECMLNHMVFG